MRERNRSVWREVRIDRDAPRRLSSSWLPPPPLPGHSRRGPGGNATDGTRVGIPFRRLERERRRLGRSRWPPDPARRSGTRRFGWLAVGDFALAFLDSVLGVIWPRKGGIGRSLISVSRLQSGLSFEVWGRNRLATMAEEEGSSPLLKKEYHYHPGCPGCAHDRRKDLQRGMPYKEFLYVWMICLTTALPISSLFPFLYFMIRDLHVARRTEDIGFYAGFVGASFMLGRCLTSTIWGIAADRIGRKPVIVFGIFSVVIFNTLFGLSVTYWMAIATRFLLGALNGLLGPIKAYAIEVCRPEHEALALSLVSTAWGIGLIIGPALGGYLALPAEKYPNVFSPDSFFGRFPYFLPCLCTSVFAAVVLISCIWLPETLHKHKVSENGNQSVEALEAHLIDPKEKVEQSGGLDTKKSLFKNWPLMSSIIVYCVFSFHDMAYTEVFSLWAESDKKYGGLSLSSEDVGQTLAITGASLLVYQLFLYPCINKALGPIKSSQIAAILCIPILFAYPYMTYLSGPGLSIILNIASVIKNNLGVTIITGTFILQNNAVPQDQRGAANGLSMTGMSFFKAVAPAGAGIVFSWAQKRQHAFFFPGDQMVFFLLNVVELLGLLLTFKPFLAVPEQYDRN